jgi:hypothetical protein
MIKQFKLLLFIGALLSILMSSCKKDVVMETSNESQIASNEIKTLVNQVKAWRDSIVSNKATGSSENNIKSLSLRQNDIVSPVIDWDKAFKNYDTIGKKGISVPLSYDPITGNYLQVVTSLVKTKITGFIVKTQPDSAYHEIHRNRFDFTNFTGSIIVYDITGKYLNQVNFKQGTPIKVNSISTNKWSQVKTFEGEDLPEVVVIGHRKRSTSYLLIFLNNLKGAPNQEFDPNFDSGGVPIGGVDDDILEIKNEITDPCLKELVNNVQNGNKLKNAIGAILNNVFGQSNRYNLIFKENNNLVDKYGYTSNGKTIPLGNGNFEIYLNALNLKKYSQERQTLTIMHEVLHGHLMILFNNTAPNNHTRILTDFIDEMATSLIDLYPSLKEYPDVAVALCFDDLQSSRGTGSTDINPSVFDDAISQKKYTDLGLNISNWQNTANKAKFPDKIDSPLGTKLPCS